MTNDAHPEELLAGYVDGSAAPDERRAVEAHLATCGRCREEVELAMSSRAALASLPELAAPGVSAAVLKAARGSVGTKADAAPVAPSLDERAARRRPVRRWRPQWNRVGIGAGLAAAAALIAIFAVVGLGSHSPTGGPAANSAQGAPSVIQRGASYSPALLQSLADQLRAPAQRKQVVSRPPAFGPAEGAASPGPAASADQAAVIYCLRSASGIGTSATPIYLEAASFQGTPAYIGAFVVPPSASGSPSHLLVIAASQSGCQPLYVVRQSI